LKLLKQARAFGVGLTLATQNPVDLDYKALSNCGTWMLGRLQTERDKARVLDGLEGVAASSGEGFDRGGLDQLLSSLGTRVFLLHNVHEKQPTLFETRWALSYLRGPMGRDELRRLCALASTGAAIPSTSAAPRPMAPPPLAAPSAPSVAAPPAPAAPSTAPASSAAPVLDPAIRQFFVPDAPGGIFEPALLAVARIAYSDRKSGVDDTRTTAVVTPIGDGAVAVNWDRAEPANVDVDRLESRPPAAAGFTSLPAAASSPKNYAAWERDFARWAAQSQAIEVLKSGRTGLVSETGEPERDFRIRVQQALREGRDLALAKVREKHTAKIRTAEDKVRRAQASVERESQQASESKISTAISFGATVVGALLRRKAVSASTLGRATTAARSMGRMSRESADVTRAEANVEAMQQQLADLQAALEADLQTVQTAWDADHDDLERVVVKPRRGGVSVQVVGLLWRSAGAARLA
ncbi:MAG: ATP-binding protein, partial [Acidobacteriota bacterium]|nr:ATP-binding protein [Acidobacteriota bacterium]